MNASDILKFKASMPDKNSVLAAYAVEATFLYGPQAGNYSLDPNFNSYIEENMGDIGLHNIDDMRQAFPIVLQTAKDMGISQAELDKAQNYYQTILDPNNPSNDPFNSAAQMINTGTHTWSNSFNPESGFEWRIILTIVVYIILWGLFGYFFFGKSKKAMGYGVGAGIISISIIVLFLKITEKNKVS